MKQKKLFCERGPVFYQISLCKEYLRRDLKDFLSKETFSAQPNEMDAYGFRHVVKSHRSLMLRSLEGVDMGLQHNKVHNLALAGSKIHGVVVQPGETFSFWHLVGATGKRQGYLPGLTISGGHAGADFGGGLCQLANLIHWMVLHSPLAVTELHHHTDSLFPDSGRRIPFGTGTSIFYKNVDYRFRNHSDRPVQLRIWQDGNDLCGELRAPAPYPYKYRIEEQDHHYAQENGKWYRNSLIYKHTLDRESRTVLYSELILRNHSIVLYDPELIPVDEIRETGVCS